MSWLQYVGDTDILRDATSSANVFFYRLKREKLLTAGAAGYTLVILLLLTLLILGPEGSGIAWAKREWVATVFAMVMVGWIVYLGWLGLKFYPGRNDRVVLQLRHWVRGTIDPVEASLRELSDDELKAKTDELKQRLADGAKLEEIRPDAYACIREASRRAREHRQFECQLIGGRVLEDSNVAEMRTGEGKTIVCYMGNYMKVLQGFKVHMVTTNDYLVKRDAEFARSIFERLGISVGWIEARMPSYGPGVEQRRENYACDITYGTNSEFGFDYLRDNMKHHVRDQVQGLQDYVVVDEVDSILIDEARTPLIISGPAHDDLGKYREANNVATSLVEKQKAAIRETQRRVPDLEANPPRDERDNPKFISGLKKFKSDPLWLTSDEAEALGHQQYFVVERDRKSAHMTGAGAVAAQAQLGIGSFYDAKNMNWPHYIDNALKAHLCYIKDKEYIVKDDQVVIVDEFTGRLMEGRQWSDGLHQAVEAKERVTVKQETQTLATITLQNLFKLYKELAGMTGTALTEAHEFMKIYQLEVIAIPTNKPIRRLDFNDKIYKTSKSKFDALVDEIHAFAFEGYPEDPWSVQDLLKTARRSIKERQLAGEADASLSRDLEVIDRGMREFKGGDNPEAVHKAYKEIMADERTGRPVLVGTVSVDSSEKLSEALTRRFGVDHEVLNARPEAIAREAEIVLKAGHQHEQVRGKNTFVCGNVTIATNMAGRGTDIRLGPGVREAGGLHVVGTERHESRRVDNQLRGRCGRQGDSGSSRFFLSMDDDLLRLFVGEWMLKMLSMLGFEEGMPIEDKRLSRGIERAQKKVEERNFHIRKNLLEYDEVMDHQRKTFYAMRQQVVEGRGLSELIWEFIDESVADAVYRYLDPMYAASGAADWAQQNLSATIDPGRLDMTDIDALEDKVRDLSMNDVRGNVERTFGEYVDTSRPVEEWDVRGLTQWAEQYGVSVTQNQVRKTDSRDLLEEIIAAAMKKIEGANLAPLARYIDKQMPRVQLIEWARNKFGVEIPLDDVLTAQPDEAISVLAEKMRSAYRQREIEYPVSAAIEYAMRRGGQNANEVGEVLARWASRKYSREFTFEDFVGKSPNDIFAELKQLNEEYMTNGKLDSEIDAALAEHGDDVVENWAPERFGAVMDYAEIKPEGEMRAQLKQAGYEMLRYELTQLERIVLLQTIDSAWKDHMYGMDLLRGSIGLRGYAEKDPKTEYKREGTRYFNEMMAAVRERVTDLIFKVRIAGFGGDGYGGEQPGGEMQQPGGGETAYAGATASKADATNAGISSAAQQADQQAAMRPQGAAAKPETFRRDEPRVGRNDPCPCGSGKKYKQCHGKPSSPSSP